MAYGQINGYILGDEQDLPSLVRTLDSATGSALMEQHVGAIAYASTVLVAAKQESSAARVDDVFEYLAQAAVPVAFDTGSTILEQADHLARAVHVLNDGRGWLEESPPPILDTTLRVGFVEGGEDRVGAVVRTANPDYLSVWERVSGAAPLTGGVRGSAEEALNATRWGRMRNYLHAPSEVLTWRRDLGPLEEIAVRPWQGWTGELVAQVIVDMLQASGDVTSAAGLDGLTELDLAGWVDRLGGSALERR